MRYRLYDENHNHKGTYNSIESLKNFLCEIKYDNDDRTYMFDTFDYIKSLNWHFEILE
tara:strand:+ start:371 stop:544 length:174 start_codon:yes stop_codon:yes gene_type:complete